MCVTVSVTYVSKILDVHVHTHTHITISRNCGVSQWVCLSVANVLWKKLWCLHRFDSPYISNIIGRYLVAFCTSSLCFSRLSCSICIVCSLYAHSMLMSCGTFWVVLCSWYVVLSYVVLYYVVSCHVGLFAVDRCPRRQRLTLFWTLPTLP